MSMTVNFKVVISKISSFVDHFQKSTSRLFTALSHKLKSASSAKLLFWHRPKPNKVGLEPLYPSTEPDEHGIYIDALNDALLDDDIHNIALTGGYGSGKSSILKGFIADKKKRTVFISFSTLGADIRKYTTENPAKDQDSSLDSIPNLIQKEIVKQILYREKYATVPASRYPKIFRTKFGSVLAWASALTAAVPLAMYALGFLSIAKLNNLKAAIFMALLFVATAFLVQAIIPLARKLQPDKISGGPVSIALSASANYFDQHLDEIIYFFEVSDYDIVVLEDIDRFNDPYIFENLRQLNTLLNNSKQINKHIRFIYAVKDSIFHVVAEADKAVGEAEKVVVEADKSPVLDGNRTKFFDLIVPTVPFITHKTSRDVMVGMFINKYGIDRNVIGIVAKHTPDMRLVKNIFNEFTVFHKKIFADSESLALSPSNLFGLIVYKNIEVQDFEKIKHGTSKLDDIYAESRSFVEERYNELNTEAVEARKKINDQDGVGWRSSYLGDKLIAHTQTLLDDKNAFLNSYQFNGKTYTRNDELKTKEFWVDMCDAADGGLLVITYSPKPGSGYYYGQPTTENLTVATVKQVVHDDLDASRWKTEESQPLRDKLTSIEKDRDSVRTKSIRKLFSEHAKFRDAISKLAPSKLLTDLIATGYIDENYALYTSIYREENVSLKGRNYIIQNIQANKQDIYYKFDGDDDVKSTLDDLDEIYFEGKNIYNFDILNYLLKAKDERLTSVVDNLSEATDTDKAFLDKFFEGKNDVEALVAHLSPVWPGIFDYIVSCVSIDNDLRNRLLHLAIVNSDNDIEYAISDSVKDYLSHHAASIGCIATASSAAVTAKAKRLLQSFKPRLVSLKGIDNQEIKKFIEENDLYEINVSNLSDFVGSANLSLDVVKERPEVLRYVSAHLADYLEVVDKSSDTKHTIENGENFVPFLNEIAGQPIAQIEKIIEKASSDCLVEDIRAVDSSLWPILFADIRAVNTVHNVLDYFKLAEQQLNDILTEYLSTSETLADKCEEEEYKDLKKVFAIAVLGSPTLKVQTKVDIVAAIELETYLGVEEFNSQNGELYGLLLEANIIEDNQETFSKLADKAWQTRESYIAKSEGFEGYVDNVKLQTEDITGIATSTIIKNEVKTHILENISSYKDEISTEGAIQFAKYALGSNVPLGANALQVLFDGSAPEVCAQLLVNNLTSLTREDVLALLPLMGGEYAKLAQASKRPTFDNTERDVRLVQRLKELAIVSSSEIKDDKLRANVKAQL